MGEGTNPLSAWFTPCVSVSFVRSHSSHGAVCKSQSFGVRDTIAKQVSVIKKRRKARRQLQPKVQRITVRFSAK